MLAVASPKRSPDPSSPWLKSGDRQDRSRVLHCRHGDGSTHGPRTDAGVVDCRERAANDGRPSVLPTVEPGARRAWLRCVRGKPVRPVLHGRGGSAEPDAGHLFPAAVDRVLRSIDSERGIAWRTATPWRCGASWAWGSTKCPLSTRRSRAWGERRRALTRWCVARGEGAAPCTGRGAGR